MQLHTLNEIARFTNLRQKALKASGRDIPGIGNIAKLSMSRILRLSRDLGLRILGPLGTLHAYNPAERKALDEATGNPFAAMVTEMALFSPGPSIYGGTDEIQHNIIGERVLGLPKEPNNDKTTPFREPPKTAKTQGAGAPSHTPGARAGRRRRGGRRTTGPPVNPPHHPNPPPPPPPRPANPNPSGPGAGGRAPAHKPPPKPPQPAPPPGPPPPPGAGGRGPGGAPPPGGGGHNTNNPPGHTPAGGGPRPPNPQKEKGRVGSFPGGIPSHAAPETPGSINEGGELGYSLSHAYGAAFDNPDLLVACVVGDGEAETGPLAASWHANKFLDPVRDGAVLPILHLNGWKIANPTVLARIEGEELLDLFRGYGWTPLVVEGNEPEPVHQAMAATLGDAVARIHEIQSEARNGAVRQRPRWPMIVLRTPKGWTGPKEVDGVPVEGTWRAHQVPLAEVRTNKEHLRLLEAWMRSYRPEELFDDRGRPRPEVTAMAPQGMRRMGANPHANGGVLLRDLVLPDFRDYGVEVKEPGRTATEPTRVLGTWLR